MSHHQVMTPSNSQTGIGWVIREVTAIDQTPAFPVLLVQRQVRIDPMLIRNSTGQQVRASEFIFTSSHGITHIQLLNFELDFQSQAQLIIEFSSSPMTTSSSAGLNLKINLRKGETKYSPI